MGAQDGNGECLALLGVRLSCLGEDWGGTREEKDIKTFSLELLTYHQAHGTHAEQRVAFANQ